MILKQSTTYTRMFKLVSSVDHIALKTGAMPTVNISKAGGSFGAAGGTVTEVANGWYKIALTTTDTNTLGDLAFYITASGADDTDFVDQVRANIDDDYAILVKTLGVVGRGVCTTGGTTTSVPTSSFLPNGQAPDQFKGRTIIFDVDTATTSLRAQATKINNSTNALAPTFTVDTLTSAPQSGDTFSVV